MTFPQYNAPLLFPQESGVVEALQNDLTLRASSSGDVLISAFAALRPETDAQQDLGRDFLRWRNLYASGINNLPIANFINPGQTSINGVSGTITLDSPNNSIAVTEVGQIISLDAIFTWASGQILEQKCRDIIILSGLILPDGGQTAINGISGVVTLTSPDESVNINVNGQDIELTTPTSGAPSGASYLLREYNDNDHLVDARVLSATSGIRLLDRGARSGSGLVITLDFQDQPFASDLLSWNGSGLEWVPISDTQTVINGLSGAITLATTNSSIAITEAGQTINLDAIFTWGSGQILEQKCRDIITLSGLILPDGGQTSINGISGAVTLDSPDESININVNGQSIEITTPTSGAPSGASYLLREYNDNDHLVDARVLSATSGVRLLDRGARSNSGLVITLDFQDEPAATDVLTWNGSGLEWITIPVDTQTSVEGLSGTIDLDSPDGTVIIGTNGQAIELTVLPDAGQTSINGLSGAVTLGSPDLSINIEAGSQIIEITTPTSGAPSGASYLLQEYNDNGHLTDARVLSATSGVRLDDQGARSGSGMVITLDFDDEPTVGQAFVWGGQKGEWTTITGGAGLNKTTRTFTPSSGLEFTVEHALNTVDWTWSMWRTDSDEDEVVLPDNLFPSGVDHAVVVFTSSDSDPSGYQGQVVFVG